MRSVFRQWTILVAALLLPTTALAAEPGQDSPVWQKLRVILFQDRPIGGDIQVELTAPERAEDPAVVPLSIRGRTAQSAAHYIKSIHLIIDNNPVPLVALFQLTPESGLADIQIRVRVEQYSHLRAVAEMNDGTLSMSTVYVKSSGGCSAPAASASPGPMVSLGKAKLTIADNAKRNVPVLAQLMIRHPNSSGMAMDQVTRLHQRQHYVRKLQVHYAGKPVMSADLSFSISENPHVRFYFTPRASGVLKAELQDTDELAFTTSLDVKLH